MIIDEIGYLPISRTGAMLFFQLMSRRYEHASTVLTSNKSFEEWGEVLGDGVMAAALIDRLLHHCHIVNIRGNSYRMREHRAFATRLAILVGESVQFRSALTPPPPSSRRCLANQGDSARQADARTRGAGKAWRSCALFRR